MFLHRFGFCLSIFAEALEAVAALGHRRLGGDALHEGREPQGIGRARRGGRGWLRVGQGTSQPKAKPSECVDTKKRNETKNEDRRKRDGDNNLKQKQKKANRMQGRCCLEEGRVSRVEGVCFPLRTSFAFKASPKRIH